MKCANVKAQCSLGGLNGRVEMRRLVKGCGLGVKSVKLYYKTLENTCFGHVGGWGGFMV